MKTLYPILHNENEFKDYMLKKHSIDVDTYSYKDDMDTDYLTQHPWILRGRQYYENPNLWRFVFDKNIENAITFLMNDTRVSREDIVLANTCLYSNRPEAIELCKRHLAALKDDKEKVYDLDNFLWILVQQNDLNNLKTLIEYAEKNNIAPIQENWGNIAHGEAISEVVKFQDPALFNYLITFKPDPDINDSMPFCIACKYGHYKQALDLAKIGYNIHTMRDLGLKMIKRNGSMNLSKENEKALKELLKMYDVKE